MTTVTSADETTIAYDRTGDGDPLILVAGAFSYRRYPGQVKLAERLAARWTVYSYAVEREIEDLAALIETAGGRAHVWGLSSGAVLALDAAAGRCSPSVRMLRVVRPRAPR